MLSGIGYRNASLLLSGWQRRSLATVVSWLRHRTTWSSAGAGLRPGLLARHRAFISLGQDEYYSLAMRHALVSARDHGVNLVFLGANAIYRHIRL